jgi:hypothetical protein
MFVQCNHLAAHLLGWRPCKKLSVNDYMQYAMATTLTIMTLLVKWMRQNLKVEMVTMILLTIAILRNREFCWLSCCGILTEVSHLSRH